MRFVLLALTAILFSSPSLASMTPVEKVLASQKRSASVHRMQMKNVLLIAVPKHQKKFLVATEIIDDDYDDMPGPDELDLQVPYRRPTIVNDVHDDDAPLSDYVIVRLAVARARAMQRYKELYT